MKFYHAGKIIFCTYYVGAIVAHCMRGLTYVKSSFAHDTYIAFCIQTTVKYGQTVQPLFWLKSQILVDWKGLFQRNFANLYKLVTFNYLLTNFEENMYKFLGIVKERIRRRFFIQVV